MQVWDISGLKLPSVGKSQARQSTAAADSSSLRLAGSCVKSQGVCKVAVWRGHTHAVTGLEWIQAPTPAAAQAAVESAKLTAAARASALASGAIATATAAESLPLQTVSAKVGSGNDAPAASEV